MFYYIGLFLFFGFLGWLFDTTYRSLHARKYSQGTWLPFFSLIYATGGIILVLIFKYLNLSAWRQIIIGWALMVLLEFFSGHIARKVLKRRLWDYTPARLDLFGHIDLLHSLYWLILVTIFHFIFPYLPL